MNCVGMIHIKCLALFSVNDKKNIAVIPPGETLHCPYVVLMNRFFTVPMWNSSFCSQMLTWPVSLEGHEIKLVYEVLLPSWKLD